MAGVTDGSSTAEFIEIDTASDGYCSQGFIHPVIEVKPEDIHNVKQEPADAKNVDNVKDRGKVSY